MTATATEPVALSIAANAILGGKNKADGPYWLTDRDGRIVGLSQ